MKEKELFALTHAVEALSKKLDSMGGQASGSDKINKK
jgi:hypothetical protein